jgi:hypothetical protein
MRIKVQEENLVKAMRDLENVEILIKDAAEAKKVLSLIIRHTEASKHEDFMRHLDFVITESLEYPTTAVEYRRYYEIEFTLDDEKFTDKELSLIRELQKLFKG